MNLFHPFSSQLLFDMGFHTYNPKNSFLFIAGVRNCIEHIYSDEIATVKPLFHRHGALFFNPSPIVVFY